MRELISKKEKKASFVSTYTVTTNPVNDFSTWYNRTLIWETARPYLFMRTTADNRIIIGGLDDNTTYPEDRDSKLIHKKNKLIEEFNKMFPEIQSKARILFSCILWRNRGWSSYHRYL